MTSGGPLLAIFILFFPERTRRLHGTDYAAITIFLMYARPDCPPSGSGPYDPRSAGGAQHTDDQPALSTGDAEDELKDYLVRNSVSRKFHSPDL